MVEETKRKREKRRERIKRERLNKLSNKADLREMY
jgi:hypothetical protein